MKCHGWYGLAQSEGPTILLASGHLCRGVLVYEAHWLAREIIKIGPSGCGLRLEEGSTPDPGHNTWSCRHLPLG